MKMIPVIPGTPEALVVGVTIMMPGKDLLDADVAKVKGRMDLRKVKAKDLEKEKMGMILVSVRLRLNRNGRITCVMDDASTVARPAIFREIQVVQFSEETLTTQFTHYQIGSAILFLTGSQSPWIRLRICRCHIS